MIIILSKFTSENKNTLESLTQLGFSRIYFDDELHKIKNLIKEGISIKKKEVHIVIDRILIDEFDNEARIADSVQTAFFEGKGECSVLVNNNKTNFSNRFELDGLTFEKPSTNLFAFNNPYGACKACEGYGTILGIDKKKVITNQNLSVYQGVVACWSGEKLSKWKDRFIIRSAKFDFPVHRPYNELSAEEIDLLWNGKNKCKGINQFFDKLESDKYKIQNRVLIARYRGKTDCTECGGSRLRKDALYVKVGGQKYCRNQQHEHYKSYRFL